MWRERSFLEERLFRRGRVEIGSLGAGERGGGSVSEIDDGN